MVLLRLQRIKDVGNLEVLHRPHGDHAQLDHVQNLVIESASHHDVIRSLLGVGSKDKQ